MNTFTIERWTRSGRLAVGGAALVLLILALLPALASGLVIDKLTTLFIYILLAVMWNLLAGFAGLVSVGQQAFFGVGGYLALRLVDAGMPPYLALVVGAAGAGIVAIPISAFALRLKGGEFAIAMWVIAEVLRIVVMFDGRDTKAVDGARTAWRAAKEASHEVTYWKESATGKWEKQG